MSEEWDPDLAFVRLPQSGPFTNSAGLNNRLADRLACLAGRGAPSLYARAKKIPLVGSRHFFYISKGSHPELESEPTGFSTDRYGAENIALLSVPLAQSIQERLKNRQPITAQAESAERTTLNSIARLLTQLKSTTKEA